MIGFGLPALLPLTLLAALPIIIHVISRARLRRLEFPSLRLLEHLQRERVAWSRLKEILLLVLRTIALLALLTALARPWLRTGAAVTGPPDLVLLFDDSYSMQHGTVWPRACSLTRVLIRSCPPDARIYLMSVTAPGEQAEPLSPARALQVIDTLSPLNTAARVLDALPAAARVAESLSARLAIVTDLQHYSVVGDWTPLGNAEVLILDAGADAPGNLAVTDLAVERPVVHLDRLTTFLVEVANYGPNPEVASIRLEADEQPLTADTRTINLPAGRTQQLAFDVRFDRPGPTAVSARLQFGADSLEVDNSRYLAVEVRDSLKVLLIGSPHVTPQLTRTALAADPTGTMSVTEVQLAQLGRQDLRRHDVVVVLDALVLEPGHWNRLLFALAGGTGLVLMTSPTSTQATALAHFARSTGTLTPSGFLSVTEVDSLHPVLADIDPALWQAPRFASAARVLPDSARVLARFSDGNPFLLEGAGGRVLIWASGPEAEFTDLVRRALFVPLLVSSVEHVTLGGRVRSVIVGDTLRFPAGHMAGDGMLTTPAGRTRLEPRQQEGYLVYEYHDTCRPGSYRLASAVTEETIALAAVNVQAEESDLRRAQPEDLPPNARVTREVDGGRDLTQLLLMLAAVALAVELLLMLI